MADPASYRPKPGTIPTEPGVYRFSDAEGVVIYVGKAINLRQRLNSYFADPAGLHFRTQTMVRTAAKVEWTLVRGQMQKQQPGSYRLAPEGDGTRVTYTLAIEPAIPMLGLLKRKVQKVILDTALKELKKHVEARRG